jgi:hypothetical protein
MRIDRYMTPTEAAAWWRKEAAKDYSDREFRQDRAYRNRMSLRAILQYVEPPKRKQEVWQGEICLPQWYKQGGFPA